MYVLLELNLFQTIKVPVNSDRLVLVALGGNHYIGFIKNKHFDFLRIKCPHLQYPVQQCTRSAYNDVSFYLLTSLH